ncbi:hypothetical protein BKA60DRAFT_586033 [Fusarium oxysporum]|nr:hypothetical protein BKA60DRAFT_586033 [Fusarium oxysporum]
MSQFLFFTPFIILYKFVRSKDPGGAITNNLIGWHGSSHYEANHLANYQHFQVWECYLCHRLFGSLNGLNQHLNSPVYLDRSGEVLSLSKTRLQEEVHDLDCYYQRSRRRGLRCTRFGNAQQGTRSMISGNRRIGF